MFGSKNTATNQSVDFEWSQFTALCNSKEMEVGKNRSIEYYRTSSCVPLSAVAKQMWSRLVISESLRASSVTTVDAWTTGQRSSRLRHVCSVPGPSWTWFLLTPALTWTTPGWSEGHVPPLGRDNNCM